MSQFLICESKENLSEYGCKLNELVDNKDLLELVKQKYFGAKDEIWVIIGIHEMLNCLEENIVIIKNIAQKSKEMVFWYGSEYEDLDNLYSEEELIDYLYSEYNDWGLELYLHVIMG